MPKYSLSIHTWENDCDHRSTQVFDNLTKSDAEFFIAVATQFHSTNWRKPGSASLGNEEQQESTLANLILAIAESHPDISEDARKFFKLDKLTETGDEENSDDKDDDFEDMGDAYDVIVKLLGAPVDYDWGFCRVYDGHNLEELPDGNVPGVTPEWVRKNPLDAYRMIVDMHTRLNGS